MVRTFVACKQRVHNRGTPPEAFLNQLVDWGAGAPDEIFVRNEITDIYSFIRSPELGPWANDRERRAAMLEVLRVLSGFESSWRWNEGRDITNPDSGRAMHGGGRHSSGVRQFDELRRQPEGPCAAHAGQHGLRHLPRHHEIQPSVRARILRASTAIHDESPRPGEAQRDQPVASPRRDGGAARPSVAARLFADSGAGACRRSRGGLRGLDGKREFFRDDLTGLPGGLFRPRVATAPRSHIGWIGSSPSPRQRGSEGTL